MKSYPRLKEMGVTHPQQIVTYSLSSLDYTDYLRIVYDRPKKSILPVSRTYRFPRVQETADSAGDEGRVVMKTDPALTEAVAELRDIVEAKSDQRCIADAMREELRSLEEEIAMHTEQLKALIGKIETS